MPKETLPDQLKGNLFPKSTAYHENGQLWKIKNYNKTKAEQIHQTLKFW